MKNSDYTQTPGHLAKDFAFLTYRAGRIGENRSNSLIHHQDIICPALRGIAVDRFSPAFVGAGLGRIVHTPQSLLLGALHLTPCW